MRSTGCLTACHLLLAGPAWAASLQVAITPASTDIAYTVFAFGIFPVQARFERFEGALTADPASNDSCTVHVVVQVDSLAMADAARTAQALGPKMLDAAHYPAMQFDGRCTDGGISGTLTLHGTSLPLQLSTRQEGRSVVATGTLQRAAFGVSGMPYVIGGHVVLRLTTRLPAGFTKS